MKQAFCFLVKSHTNKSLVILVPILASHLMNSFLVLITCGDARRPQRMDHKDFSNNVLFLFMVYVCIGMMGPCFLFSHGEIQAEEILS